MIPRGAQAYRDVDLNSSVLSASPVQLVVLLYAGAIAALKNANEAIRSQRFGTKSEMISKAMDIIECLRLSIDAKRGGEIALSLNELYVYMMSTLMKANFANDTAQIDSVVALLEELNGAWLELAQPGAAG